MKENILVGGKVINHHHQSASTGSIATRPATKYTNVKYIRNFKDLLLKFTATSSNPENKKKKTSWNWLLTRKIIHHGVSTEEFSWSRDHQVTAYWKTTDQQRPGDDFRAENWNCFATGRKVLESSQVEEDPSMTMMNLHLAKKARNEWDGAVRRRFLIERIRGKFPRAAGDV